MLKPETEELGQYLQYTEIIDFRNDLLQSVVKDLKDLDLSEVEYVKKVYEYVRDEFPHSFDIRRSDALEYEISCSASDVIRNGHGICYAKSHLLAAILRCSGIPTGFCYQKLIFSDENPKLILHGVNAVFLYTLAKWIRLDARGNKEGVNAQFTTSEEKLAFPVRLELGESDGNIIYVQPSSRVVNTLKYSKTLNELMDNLPDEI